MQRINLGVSLIKVSQQSIVIFDLYDFNEIQSLSTYDLQFLILSVCECVQKIYYIPKVELNQEIAQLVYQSFNEGNRITLPSFLKWASNTQEVKAFFQYYDMEAPQMTAIKPLSETEFEIYESHMERMIAEEEQLQRAGDKFRPIVPFEQDKRFIAKQAYQLTNNKKLKHFRAWCHSALQPVVAFRLKQRELFQSIPDELKTKLEWVYGIRSHDTHHPLQYTCGFIGAQTLPIDDEMPDSQEKQQDEIVYFIASIVILLNISVNKQRFYIGHDQEVISVAVSTVGGEFVASAELALIPCIHVWERRTLTTISVIKGDHATGVHLMQFTLDNKFLVTCGITNPSAVIIYDWRAGQVRLSTSLYSPTQQIFIMPEIKYDKGQNEEGEFELAMMEEMVSLRRKRARVGICILSLRELCIFIPKEDSFDQILVSLDECMDEMDLYEPLCGLSLVADETNRFYGQLDVEVGMKRHLILTGHKDGHVLVWRSDAYIGMLDYFKDDEITAINRSKEGILICTWSGSIHIYRDDLKGREHTLSLGDLPHKLLNYNICSVDFNQNRILLLTMAGDACELYIDYIDMKLTVKSVPIRIITKVLGSQKAMAILSLQQQIVMVGGDEGLLLSFDMTTHNMVDVFEVSAKITAIAVFNTDDTSFISAIGTSSGNVIFRADWSAEHIAVSNCGNKPINDLVFSKNGMMLCAASNDKNVYLFNYDEEGMYSKGASCKLENGVPVAVNFSEDSQKILVMTNQRRLIIIDSQTFQSYYQLVDITKHLWSNFTGKHITKANTQLFNPIVLGNKSNIVVAGDEHGNIYLWRDLETVKEHVGVNLIGHSSPLTSILLTQDDKRMVSIGLNDNCILQWKVTPVEYKSIQTDKLIIVKQHQAEQKEEAQPAEYEDSLASKIYVKDESLVNEMNFCYVQPTTEENEDIKNTKQDNGVLIRGCNQPAINRINSKLNFNFTEEEWKRPPPIGLIIDHIYGVQTSDRRNTVLYMHFHGDKPPEKIQRNSSITQQLGIIGANNSRLDKVLPKLLGPNFQELLDPGQQIKYDKVHMLCHQHLVYFTSKFGILYSPLRNTQTFYQGHEQKISCIQKHPTRRLIATGDVSSPSTIHIWDAHTLESLIILETAHKGGVLHLSFSSDGKKLISIGMDRVFSLQVFLWEQNRTLAFRHLGYYPVFGVKFYPYDNNRFVTCGYQHMSVWRLNGNHLTCIAFQRYDSKKINQEEQGKPLKSILTCVDFMNFRLGHEIQSDMIFGTDNGEITTYTCGKHFVLNENAHKGVINCLCISDKLNDTLNIITGGEDGYIKIWNTSIQLLQSVDMRTCGNILTDLKNQRCYGVQSIEMYCCDKECPRKLLIGLRCGEILEANITDEPGKLQQQSIQRPLGQTLIGMGSTQKAMLQFDFITFVSAHSSLAGSLGQKKIVCVVNPQLPVLASVGDDETLRFWDLLRKQIIVSKHLGNQATAIAYSSDGRFLVIGLINGIVLVMEARIQKLSHGTYLEKFTMPSLDILMSPKEAKSSIVCIRFSYQSDFLAVAFNNEFREGDIIGKKNVEDLGKRDPSFVILYVNRLSKKNPGKMLNSKDPYVKLCIINIPLQDFQSSAAIRKQLAVTNLDFDRHDQYLQLCLQMINHEVIVDPLTYNSGSNNIFVIWDLSAHKPLINFEAVKNSQWPDWSMAPAINARFHGKEIHLEDAIEEHQLLHRELCFMNRISRFTVQNNAIAGSHSGYLYIFRFDALTIDKTKVNDFKYDLVQKKQMAASRAFQAHTSMIQSIEIWEDKKVLSTSVSDQCIVQWRVEFEDKHWELDFNQITMNTDTSSVQPQQPQDPYFEFLSKIRFERLLTEIWAQRLLVSEINQKLERAEQSEPACELELQYIIGRRAYDRRMNVKIDCMDRITYQASSLQVFLTESEEDNDALKEEGFNSRIKQDFLRPDGNKFRSVSPELSCFCFSKDARIIFIATAQTTANVYIWEVTTNMKLGQFTVPNVPVITNIKVSHDTRFVLILGTSKEYYQMITMIEWQKGNQILFTRQFLHSLTSRIRDIEFFPESNRQFVSAGIQHLCFWKLNGNNLEYQCGELTIPRAFSSKGKFAYNLHKVNYGRFGLALVSKDGQVKDNVPVYRKNAVDDDLENLMVTFLNVSFIGANLVTSGDDGFLYLWEGQRIMRRIFAHEGAVYALHCNSKLGLIVSGGMEGIVILWRLNTEQQSNVKSLERLKIYDMRKGITDPQEAISNPECNVQSLCLGLNRIVVGMRTGSIYEVVISEDKKIIKPHHNQDDPCKQWLKGLDHETPFQVGTDDTTSRIYTITKSGLLSIWDLYSFDIIYQKDYKMKTKFLRSFRLSNRLLLVFEHEIFVLDTDPIKNTYQEFEEYKLTLNLITFATMNQDEQILGVATISQAQPEVTLFATDGGFMKIKCLSGFKSSIRYLDFSTDNFYMQVEDSVGEVQLFELENDRIMENEVQFELEWLGEGLRSYSRIRGIVEQYNTNNKIVCIQKLLGKPVVAVADELGTLRLYNYPNIDGQSYYQCYSEHLFYISDCLFTPDFQNFLTVCGEDRCVFKWRVKLDDEKIQQLKDEDQELINAQHARQ